MMRASAFCALLYFSLVASVSEGADQWIVGTVKGNNSETIEIAGKTAKAIFEKLENIKGTETFGQLSKIGKNIQCSRLGIDPKLKNSPAGDYSYKCYFQVSKNGELDPPKSAAGLTPAM
jgi:hypothetical protein